MHFILVEQPETRSSSFVDYYPSFWIISDTAAVVMNGNDSMQKGR